MGRLYKIELLSSLTLCLLLAIGISCSRPLDIPSEQGVVHADQTPFRDDSTSVDSADGPVETALSGMDHVSYDPGPPFRNDGLPAGTLLSVRIEGPIAIDRESGKGSFGARIDQPVVVNGRTLIASGSSVVGRIESSRVSKIKPSRGYFELALASVEIAGTPQTIRTAGLFVRQRQAADGAIVSSNLDQWRRLTFQLLAPMYPGSRPPQETR